MTLVLVKYYLVVVQTYKSNTNVPIIYLNANNLIVDIIKKLHKSFIAITQAESERESSTVESGVLARSMVV